MFTDPSQTYFWTPKARRLGLRAHHIWAPNMGEAGCTDGNNVRSRTVLGRILLIIFSSLRSAETWEKKYLLTSTLGNTVAPANGKQPSASASGGRQGAARPEAKWRSHPAPGADAAQPQATAAMQNASLDSPPPGCLRKARRPECYVTSSDKTLATNF